MAEWVFWAFGLWAAFAGGAAVGARFSEVGLQQRERRVAAGRAELGALRRQLGLVGVPTAALGRGGAEPGGLSATAVAETR